MTKKQEFLVRACKHYNLNIELNPTVIFPSGTTIIADAVISNSKNDSKMWIFTKSPTLNDLDSLTKKGDGYSCWDNPQESDEFEIADYTDIFSDWGFI